MSFKFDFPVKYLSAIHKHFYWWSLLFLTFLGALIRLYRIEVSLIAWPVSGLLSAYLLSCVLFLIQNRLKKVVINIGSILTFSIIHWILTGFFEIILTRFFRLEEQYVFREFDQYLLAHQTNIVDGFLLSSFYLFLFTLIRSQNKSEYIIQDKKALEKKLSASELNLLNNEINPHFLFNAMNGIAMKVRLGENKIAVTMIAALNDLLRLSLSKKKDELITLSEELELLDKYLIIEQVRFGDHFSLSLEVPDEIKPFKVPKLILQPLVENAFKHGIDQNLKKMMLRVDGQSHENYLNLTVYNSQNDLHKLNYASSNIGLPNVVHRLRNLFDTDFKFQSFSEKGGVAFKVTLPIIK